jgi:hypothetical protein
MLKELLEDHETGMSLFQDNYFVTTKAGGTLYGQYKQSLRELYRRFRGLRELTFNRKRLEVDIKETLWKSKNSKDEFERERSQIDYEEKIVLTEESDRAIKDTTREFKNFLRQALFLKEKIGTLTDEKKHQLDKEMWKYKLKEMACVDLLSTGRLSNNTIEMANAFEKSDRLKLLNEIKDHENLIEWYENKDEHFIPDDLSNIEIPHSDIKLIEDLTKRE